MILSSQESLEKEEWKNTRSSFDVLIDCCYLCLCQLSLLLSLNGEPNTDEIWTHKITIPNRKLWTLYWTLRRYGFDLFDLGVRMCVTRNIKLVLCNIIHIICIAYAVIKLWYCQQVKYYNAEGYEVGRFEDAILKYQVSLSIYLDCFPHNIWFDLKWI